MTQFTRILLVAFVAFVLTGGVVAYTIQEESEELPLVFKPVREVVVSVVPSLDEEKTIELQVAELPSVDNNSFKNARVAQVYVENGAELSEVVVEGDIEKIRAILEERGEAMVIVLVVDDVSADEVLEMLAETEFTPRHIFEVTNGFAGTIDIEMFELLLKSNLVKSISLDEPVGTNE